MSPHVLAIPPAVLLVATSLPAPTAPSVPAGKVDTGRTVELSVLAEGTPAEVSELWASPAGLARFLAPAAVIDPRVGGRYEVIFAPRQDPQGADQGTKASRVLV
jgi:hypothetical protein